MAITETHNVSGLITLGSGASAVMSGHSVTTSISGNTVSLTPGTTVQLAPAGVWVMSGQVNTSVSGNVVQTSISGNIIQTSISGNAISISGDILVTSFSGNVITVINASTTPTVNANFLQVTGASGGIQFPNIPVTASMFVYGVTPYSGGSSPPLQQLAIGGVGNNAPYFDPTLTPTTNGVILDQIITIPPQKNIFGVTNMNQLSVVINPSFSGAYIHYYAA